MVKLFAGWKVLTEALTLVLVVSEISRQGLVLYLFLEVVLRHLCLCLEIESWELVTVALVQ